MYHNMELHNRKMSHNSCAIILRLNRQDVIGAGRDPINHDGHLTVYFGYINIDTLTEI